MLELSFVVCVRIDPKLIALAVALIHSLRLDR